MAHYYMEAYAHQRYPKIQRRATEFILGQGLSLLTYKERLVKLNLLPLMYHLELADIMFYVNSYKNRSPRFNISDYVTPTTGYTRSSVNHSLNHTYSRTNNLITTASWVCGTACHQWTWTSQAALSNHIDESPLTTLPLQFWLWRSLHISLQVPMQQM